MPSQVASYNDDDLIGTTATTADANFDEAHPLYAFLGDLAALKGDHAALRNGAQVHRYSTSEAGIYAFSRIDADEGIEYVVALNNAETAKTQTIQTYSADAGFSGLWPAGVGDLTSNGSGQITITVPPLSAVVYRADTALSARLGRATVTLAAPADGATVVGQVEVGATLADPEFAEVTFAVKVGGAADWTVIGTDDNAPYRGLLRHGRPRRGHRARVQGRRPRRVRQPRLRFRHGRRGRGRAATGRWRRRRTTPSSTTSGRPATTTAGASTSGATSTRRSNGPAPSRSPARMPTARSRGSSSLPNAAEVGFIPHKGDEKDPGPDRFFNPSQNPEIWLQAGRPDGLHVTRPPRRATSTIHYQRPDGDYDGWGLHLWGDAIDPSEGTDVGRRPSRRPRSTTTGRTGRSSLGGCDAARQLHHPQGRREGPGPGPSFLPDGEPDGLAPVGRLDDPPDPRLRRGLRGHPLPPPRRRLRRRDLVRLQRLLGPPHVGRAPRPGSGVDGTRSSRPARIASARSSSSTSTTTPPSSPTSSTAATRRIPAPTSPRPRQRRATRSGTCRAHGRRPDGEVPAADPGGLRDGRQPVAPEGALADREHARLGHRPAARRRVRAPLRPRRRPCRRRRRSPAARRSRWPASPPD